jgi:hypothetical protein
VCGNSPVMSVLFSLIRSLVCPSPKAKHEPTSCEEVMRVKSVAGG